MHSAFAKAAEVAFEEFEGTHLQHREWVLHMGTLRAIGYFSSRQKKLPRNQVSALKKVAKRVLEFYKPDPEPGEADSSIKNISDELQKHFSNPPKKVGRNYYLMLSAVAENGVRAILARKFGKDYLSLKTNMSTSFDQAEKALHQAILTSNGTNG